MTPVPSHSTSSGDPREAGALQTGEVGIEIMPILAASSLESKFAARLDWRAVTVSSARRWRLTPP